MATASRFSRKALSDAAWPVKPCPPAAMICSSSVVEMAPNTLAPAWTNCSTSAAVEVLAMTAPLASCGAVAAPGPVWLLGTFSWTNWSPRMVVRAMAALTSAGMRTLLSKVSVTLALLPLSAMLLTEPTGTSASCTWAPLARSPTSLKTAVAVRWSEPPPMEQPVSPAASARTAGTRSRRRRSPVRIRTSSRCRGPTGRAGRAIGDGRGGRAPAPWSWGSGGSSPAAGAVRLGAWFDASTCVAGGRRLARWRRSGRR